MISKWCLISQNVFFSISGWPYDVKLSSIIREDNQYLIVFTNDKIIMRTDLKWALPLIKNLYFWIDSINHFIKNSWSTKKRFITCLYNTSIILNCNSSKYPSPYQWQCSFNSSIDIFCQWWIQLNIDCPLCWYWKAWHHKVTLK
mgnify:CR=1 FL=1